LQINEPALKYAPFSSAHGTAHVDEMQWKLRIDSVPWRDREPDLKENEMLALVKARIYRK
jgi:hypothetical protein